MRTRVLILTGVLLVAAGPGPGLAADIGSLQFDLKSGGLDAIEVLLGTTSIPVEAYFSATASGVGGANDGAQVAFADITGDALVGSMQSPLTLNPVFTSVLSSGGLGFDLTAYAGTGISGGIYGFGGGQALPGGVDFVNGDAQYAGHPAGAHSTDPDWPLDTGDQLLAAVGPVMFASGMLNLRADLVLYQTYAVSLTGDGNLWEVGGEGAVAPGGVDGDTLTITVIPEPAALGLLGLGGLAMIGRRRRQWLLGGNGFRSVCLLVAAVALTAAPVWGQPRQWSDDFQTAATYDSASLYSSCFGGPSPKYTLMEAFTGDIYGERAVSGNGRMTFTNRTINGVTGVGRLEFVAIGILDFGQPCPDNPDPSPGASVVTSEPFTSADVCMYGGVQFTDWQLRLPSDSFDIRGADGKCGKANVDDDLNGMTDENAECLACRPTTVNSGYGNANGTGFRGGVDAAPGFAGVDDDGNGIIDDFGELGWPGSDDGDDTTRQAYWAVMDMEYAETSVIYLEIEAAAPGRAFNMRGIVNGSELQLEAANETGQSYYRPGVHYNWAFCVSGTCYGAVLWDETDMANPDETLGPLTNTDHTRAGAAIVGTGSFQNSSPLQYIRQQRSLGNSNFSDTFWVVSGSSALYYPSPSSDFDRDKDVDGFDFMTFSNCYNGSLRAPLAGCSSVQADLDRDGDVDGFDFISFSRCFNKSNRKPREACFPPNLTNCGS